jgi:hypothetical protein
MADVAAIFVRKDSVYKAMSGVDCWDAQRNALYWPGGIPVVAHPPCAQWGTMRHMARVDPMEKVCALFAIAAVREFGGVLEHPKRSRLWPLMGLPKPGASDTCGGWTLAVNQWWWGHQAEKATLLYIVGCPPAAVPMLPQVPPGKPKFTCGKSGRRKDGTRNNGRSEITKAAREVTPPDFAAWLVQLAMRCKR